MLEMIELYHFENDYLFCHKGVTISTGRLRLKNFRKKCLSDIITVRLKEIPAAKGIIFLYDKQGHKLYHIA